MKIGSSILKLRKDNGLSQDQFAESFHVTRQTVSNWENEKSYPDLETIIHISNKFNISVDEILKSDEKMVKKIDNEKKGKRFLLVILSIVILISALSIFFIYKEAEEHSKISFDMKRKQTYQTENMKTDYIDVQTGYFILPKSGKVTFAASGSIDDGALLIKVVSNGGEEICYQINGQNIDDTQTIYMENGSYIIQVVANEYTEDTVSLEYRFKVSN